MKRCTFYSKNTTIRSRTSCSMALTYGKNISGASGLNTTKISSDCTGAVVNISSYIQEIVLYCTQYTFLCLSQNITKHQCKRIVFLLCSSKRTPRHFTSLHYQSWLKISCALTSHLPMSRKCRARYEHIKSSLYTKGNKNKCRTGEALLNVFSKIAQALWLTATKFTTANIACENT